MAKKPRTHRWVDDACVRCGLRRRETWLLDDSGLPVMALVWSDRGGDLVVQPFPRMLGVEPPSPPTQTRAEAFGSLPVGPEPPCEDPDEPDEDADDPEDREVPGAPNAGSTSSSSAS